MEDYQLSEFKRKGLVFQYWFTILAAIPLGVAIIFFPEFTKRLFNFKEQDRIVFGISGSVYFAFGTLSILGLKDPLKWSPILLLQFLYKMTWLLAVIALMAVRGELEFEHAAWLLAGYIAMVAGDIWAMPWGYLLGKHVTGERME